MQKFIVTKNSLVAETLKSLGYYFVRQDGEQYYFINKEGGDMTGVDKNKIAYTDILSI